MQGKKKKFTSWPLSKEGFEHAKKDKLCFLCMGIHTKRYFPRLKKAIQRQTNAHATSFAPRIISTLLSSTGLPYGYNA